MITTILSVLSQIPGIAKLIGGVSSVLKYLSFIWDLASKERLTESYFDTHLNKVYDIVASFLTKVKACSPSDTKREKDRILALAKKKHASKKDGYFSFNTEDIEDLILNEFLRGGGPKGINRFLRFVFFYENSNSKLYAVRLLWERVKSKLWFKHTFYHYMSIPRWNSLSRADLQEKVKNVKTVSPYLTGFYDFRRSKLVTEEKESSIFKVISTVVKSGFLSEDTLLKLSSSQKLLMVHKYSEGMSGLMGADRDRISALREIILKHEDSEEDTDKKQVLKAEKEIQKIEGRKTRVPLGVALEKTGFIKLFRNMAGVYVYPLWKLKADYQSDPNLFFEEKVFPVARQELARNIKKDSRISELGGGLKYVVLYHTLSVQELEIMESERDFSLSSPKLSKNLLVSFLHDNPNNLSSVYVNSLIQNVSFWSFISSKSKTGAFLLDRKQQFEELLQAEGCDASVAMSLLTLNDIQVARICKSLLGKSKKIRMQDLKKLVSEQLKFYADLQEELNSLHHK